MLEPVHCTWVYTYQDHISRYLSIIPVCYSVTVNPHIKTKQMQHQKNLYISKEFDEHYVLYVRDFEQCCNGCCKLKLLKMTEKRISSVFTTSQEHLYTCLLASLNDLQKLTCMPLLWPVSEWLGLCGWSSKFPVSSAMSGQTHRKKNRF